jgi:hypothetical protein
MEFSVFWAFRRQAAQRHAHRPRARFTISLLYELEWRGRALSQARGSPSLSGEHATTTHGAAVHRVSPFHLRSNSCDGQLGQPCATGRAVVSTSRRAAPDGAPHPPPFRQAARRCCQRDSNAQPSVLALDGGGRLERAGVDGWGFESRCDHHARSAHDAARRRRACGAAVPLWPRNCRLSKRRTALPPEGLDPSASDTHT